MKRMLVGTFSPSRCCWMLLIGSIAWCSLSRDAAAQQLTPDQMATMLLDAGRRAYNERNLPFAADRFREFLKAYGNHKEANSARYGLGLTLMELPAKDYAATIEALKPVADVQDFADRPLALYYLGAAYRGSGQQSLAAADAKPAEAAQHRKTAGQQFAEAATRFAAANTAFAARIKTPPAADANPLPADLEWAARARCDQAEMLLRTDKPKEAAALVEPFKDPLQVRSRYRNLGRYYYGYASYAQRDWLTAGRTLSQLAPFENTAYRDHARYLLARTHHLSEERGEALALYESLLKDFDVQQKAAIQAIKDPNALKSDPEERARLESLAKNPPPDFVARASFYLGVLHFEQARFAEALDRLGKFPQQYAGSLLIPEAQLRQGFCQVQLKQFAEAIKTLQPLQDHAQWGDQARWWLARAQIGAADANNVQAVAQSQTAAIDHLRKAADRASQLAATDPDAKLRRADMLLELADTQQSAKQYKDAAATYQIVLTETPTPERAEQALQRQATALHLNAQYKESDDACQRFQQAYPKSPLLAAVLFRRAENGYAVADAAAANKSLPNRVDQLKQLFGETIKRYQALIEAYPEFAYINLARQGLAMSHYQLGQFTEAAAALKSIPDADRNGPLAAVPYVLADCLIRTAPADADDALAAGRLLAQLGDAIKLLDSFLAGQPAAPNASPQTPDALIKLGDCHQRIAAIMVEPQERNKILTVARQSYEKLTKDYGNHALNPVAIFERAKCLAQAGDVNGAANELNRFTSDPLKAAPIAPLAMLRLSALQRAQGKAAEAATLLAQCRAAHEAALTGDPSRAAWVPLIQYHQGLALKESNKLPEAQTIFDAIVKQFAGKPEAAEAAWRAGQCRKDQFQIKLDAARAASAKLATNPAAKPEEVLAANTAIQDALKGYRDTAQYFESQIAPLAQQAAGSEPHLRMFYEAAWCQRTLADAEVDVARQKLREESLKKLQEAAVKATAAGQPVPVVNAPEIARAAIPLQPSEQKAREHYAALIKTAPETQLAQLSRLELAEVHALREEHDPAIALLQQALTLEPPADLSDRVQLRLGCCLLAKNNPKGAAAQIAAVAQSTQKPLAAEARYRQAEALMMQQDWSAAIQQLVPFRDQDPLKNVPAVSDRALLRLGHAYAHAAQWDPSRQALEALVSRFPQSPWLDEARYGIGWSWQNVNQFDNAANAYTLVVRNTTAEVAAKAQLQIGLCRLAQKKPADAATALLIVPFTYDYPEYSAMALCEAARAFVELKQPEQAATLLRRVIKDHPNGRWAEMAKQRLAEIK